MDWLQRKGIPHGEFKLVILIVLAGPDVVHVMIGQLGSSVRKRVRGEDLGVRKRCLSTHYYSAPQMLLSGHKSNPAVAVAGDINSGCLDDGPVWDAAADEKEKMRVLHRSRKAVLEVLTPIFIDSEDFGQRLRKATRFNQKPSGNVSVQMNHPGFNDIKAFQSQDWVHLHS